jgi:hypothetical protein
MAFACEPAAGENIRAQFDMCVRRLRPSLGHSAGGKGRLRRTQREFEIDLVTGRALTKEERFAQAVRLQVARKLSAAPLTGRSILESASYQAGFMGLEVILHGVNPTRLCSTHLPQVPHHAVMNKSLAQLHDLNVSVFGLPPLPGRQWLQALLAVRLSVHAT